MNIDQLLAKYVTGNWVTSDLPKLALAALELGLESESLIILAGLSELDNSFEIEHYFSKALLELGRKLPDKRTAAIDLALYYADEIIDERLDPFEGTYKIINEALRSYDFWAENKKYVMDSIGFEKVYGSFVNLDDLKNADRDWSKTKTNLQLEAECTEKLVEDLKAWKRK